MADLREYRRMTGDRKHRWHWRLDCHGWPVLGGFNVLHTTRLPEPRCASCGQLERWREAPTSTGTLSKWPIAAQ